MSCFREDFFCYIDVVLNYNVRLYVLDCRSVWFSVLDYKGVTF